jgi:putative ABC transport system ATP-binding protein
VSVPALSARGISVAFGEGRAQVWALDGVDLDAHGGEMLALMGPSGSGKTTLLMVLGGLLRPQRGAVEVLGTAVTGQRDADLRALRLRRFGFVFQGYQLFPALTALENVALALELKGRDRRAATALLDRVGLAARRHHFPAALSGGEKQRVAIARALAGDPAIVLADEPTAALDTANGRAVVALLRELAAEGGRAVVMVTHDPRAGDAAHRVIRMVDGRLAA